jgi:hypothetical protein
VEALHLLIHITVAYQLKPVAIIRLIISSHLALLPSFSSASCFSFAKQIAFFEHLALH